MRLLPNTLKVTEQLKVFNESIKATHNCSIGNRYCNSKDGLCDSVPGSFTDECGVLGCKKFG